MCPRYHVVTHRIWMICRISSSKYGLVLTINTRSRRSTGRPWGLRNLVPRIRDMPLFEAMMTKGDNSFSSARFRKEKHSMSSICTSSMKRTCTEVLVHDQCCEIVVVPTPGMISALPSSRHSATLVLIWLRSSGLISPVSPAKRARKPCVRLLITSIS